MKLSTKKVAVGLGVLLFGVQLGGQSVHADMIQEGMNVSKIAMAREGEIPELPSDPQLPSEGVEDSGNTEMPPVGEENGGSTDSSEPEIPELPEEMPDNSGGSTDSGNDGGGGTTDSTTPPSEDSGNNGSGSNEGGGTTDSTTPPSEDLGNTGSGNNGGGGTTDSTTPPSSDNENKPVKPTPPSQNVVVKPDGTIGGVTNSGAGTNSNGSQNVPIISNDIDELTHIPTPSTPVETETGEKIVSVVDGVAYKEAQGGTLLPINAEVKELPSGNIAVKGSDGEMKILPKTGMDKMLGTALVGAVLLAGSSWYLYSEKKKRKDQEEKTE